MNSIRGSGETPDEFGFGDWNEDQLPSDIEELVEELSVPVRKTARHIGEVVHSGLEVDFQRRLDALRVEDPRSATKWKIRRHPELLMSAYALDDLHYAVYERRRAKSPSSFISITFKEIMAYETKTNIAQLQRNQTLESYLHLVDLGLNADNLYKMTTSESPEEKFLVRSLARVLKEDFMAPFTDKLLKEAIERASVRPLEFEEVATRAARKVDQQYRAHMALDTRSYSTDERMWHLLITRKLERAKAFAEPLAGAQTSSSYQ